VTQFFNTPFLDLTSHIPFSHLKVELHQYTNKFAWFRIMPKFKVRTEGDQIRVEDQVSRSIALIE